MNIESVYEIIKRNINYNNYFESLISLLYKYNLISNNKIYEFNNVLIYKIGDIEDGKENNISLNEYLQNIKNKGIINTITIL